MHVHTERAMLTECGGIVLHKISRVRLLTRIEIDVLSDGMLIRHRTVLIQTCQPGIIGSYKLVSPNDQCHSHYQSCANC
jgi:hypothetical protein